MKYAEADILKSLASRSSNSHGSRWGIGTAAQYLESLVPCLSGGQLCPTKLFNLASPEVWKKHLEEAASRFTYCDATMGDTDFLIKSVREGTDITKGAVLEYDCILTSATKDRDGDIVEPKGMVVDANMPALWMHMQVQPIGKFVKLLSHDDLAIKGRYALADTELGRDAATLVKFGALRVSIGFRPSVYEPIEIVKGSDGREYAKGWHIHQGTIMEKSLVSVPANSDAVITAFSQGKLHQPLVKSWAKSFYDSRPVQVAGANVTAGGLSIGGVSAGDGMNGGIGLTTKSAAAIDATEQLSPIQMTIKQGRVLSAANQARVSAAIQELVSVLEDAGIDLDIELTATATSPTKSYTISVGKSLDSEAAFDQASRQFAAAAIGTDGDRVQKSLSALNSMFDKSAFDQSAGLLSVLADAA